MRFRAPRPVGAVLLLTAFSLLGRPLLPAQTTAATASSFKALAAKADAARGADRLAEAVALYQKALVLRPSWTEGWFSLGTIHYDQNAYAEAARAFRRATALDPKAGTALAMLGLCEFELGQDDLALKHLQASRATGMAQDPQLRKVVLYHEGVLLQRKQRFESAQQTLEQLCLQGVQNDDVANALGMVLLRSPAKAPPQPGSQDADIVLRLGRAECLAGQKKYEDARKDFSAVVSQYPQYPNIHYAFGLFLEEARDTQAAVSEFQGEIRNNPAHILARLQIASVLYKEDSATGLPFAQEAVKLDPRLPFARYLLGLLLLDTDRYQQAIPELELAQQAFPRDAKLYLALGSAYARAGRKQDAARARAMFAKLDQQNKERANAPEHK